MVSISSAILLFLAVRSQTKQSTRHSFMGSIDESKTKRIKLVRTQTILYVAAYVNNFVWLIIMNSLVLNSVDSDDIHGNDKVIFASGIMLFLFMPSYGFFNFCIYCYPRYSRIKEHFPEKSRMWCVQLLYTKDEGESEILIRRRCQSHLRGGSTGTFSIAGIPTTTPTGVETMNTADNSKKLSKGNTSEQGETSSFHGSGGEPLNNLELAEDEDVVTNNNCHTTLIDECTVEMDSDNKLYVDY
jgi:hypothetical protein